ncbi:MAG: hypothetical protein P1U57_03170 [Oleibacter sp.]|nr:hypothetical protein [Thalassolituus sp.]
MFNTQSSDQLNQQTALDRIQLSDFALIHISGPDSERFLQGQITCDVAKMSEHQWQAGACCNAKGRMVANFIIVRRGEDFFIRLPSEQVDVLLQHLKKYAVFFKTTLSPSTKYQIFGLLPANAANETQNRSMSNALVPSPLLPRTCEWQQKSLHLQWPDGREELWEVSKQTLADVNSHSEQMNPWRIADILAGWIWVTPVSTESWIPQHIGWQHLHGISFSKGCYTGQEVVARLQYLGKSKRNVFYTRAETPLPEVLTPVVSCPDDAAVSSKAKTIGELAAVCGQHALAILSVEEDTLETKCEEIPLHFQRVSYTEEK